MERPHGSTGARLRVHSPTRRAAVSCGGNMAISHANEMQCVRRLGADSIEFVAESHAFLQLELIFRYRHAFRLLRIFTIFI
ncbi:hypothetical protein [Burkholderia savannae]|uniref:hypothetical protein n=1 Tax=Burkholderia savannae TaxID=1637837 RepID=UPI0012E3A426|nr:hypothetical protein [Burkholderia savannae]